LTFARVAEGTLPTWNELVCSDCERIFVTHRRKHVHKSTDHNTPAQRVVTPARAAYSAKGRPDQDSLGPGVIVIGSSDCCLHRVSAVCPAKAERPGRFRGSFVSVRRPCGFPVGSWRSLSGSHTVLNAHAFPDETGGGPFFSRRSVLGKRAAIYAGMTRRFHGSPPDCRHRGCGVPKTPSDFAWPCGTVWYSTRLAEKPYAIPAG